jgi:hypothetical protein
MIRGIPVYEGGFEATPVFVTAACDKKMYRCSTFLLLT